MLPWENHSMHVNQFFLGQREPVNLKAHASIREPGMKIYVVFGLGRDGYPRGIAQFVGGTSNCLPGLHNFWANQLSLVTLCNFLKEASLTVLHNFLAQQATWLDLCNF